MKVVILAGGLGTRLSEETIVKPKPMVEIGEYPILWHIMKIYAHYGYKNFIICLGYKGYVIKEYFANYYLHNSDFTLQLKSNEIKYENSHSEDWTVTLVDTGLNTQTGGRIKRIEKYVKGEAFMVTYGDGLSDVNINALVESHKNSKKMTTVTAVMPPGRFGALTINGEIVTKVTEKPRGDNSWINGGFFVVEPGIFDLISGDDTIWERGPLEEIAKKGGLGAFKHGGFWHAMDTMRDRNELNDLWRAGKAPWKVWND